MSTDTRLDEEAADWLVQLEDDAADLKDAALQRNFFDWLRRSPRHVKAFLDSADAFRVLDGLDSQRRIDVRALIGERMPKVVAMHRVGERAASSWTWKLAAGFAVVVVGVLLYASIAGKSEYTTAVGEQRTFKLEDGSVLYLNTQSRAQVEFSHQAREVKLLEGEALFVVEHDAARPFIVDSGGVPIRVLGTQFNVYRRADATSVSVVEGAVLVGEIRLAAGEEASVARGRISKRAQPDVAGAVAWRSRRLVFRDTPLAAVATEFNRYNSTQIRVEGEAARDKELTGIFSADHPQSLILYVKKDESLAVEQSGTNITIRAR